MSSPTIAEFRRENERLVDKIAELETRVASDTRWINALSKMRRDDTIIIEGLAQVLQDWSSISRDSFIEIFVENDMSDRLDDLGLDVPLPSARKRG